MSYNERPDGYQGVKYGAVAMTLIGAGFVLKMCGGLAGIFGGLPPMTPLAAQSQLLNDPQSGPLFKTLQKTYPSEFDGLTNELARRGAEFQSKQDIVSGGRAYLLAAMKRHLGEIGEAPHARCPTIAKRRSRRCRRCRPTMPPLALPISPLASSTCPRPRRRLRLR